jgi:hypothetical protein
VLTHEFVPKLVFVPSREHEPVLPDAAEGEVEIWVGNDGFEAYGYRARGYFWAQFPGTATYRFLEDDSSVAALPESGVDPEVVADVYYRNVLPLVLQLRGHEVLHASAVGTKRGLIVLCGVSGTGKSTFAYRLSERGYALWADDAVALQIDADEIVAFQVPFRLGLRKDTATFFGYEAGERHTEDAGPLRSPILALVMLASSDAPDAPLTSVAQLKPANAFAALLPHAYYFMVSNANRKAKMMDRYLLLASSVPAVEFRYRPGLDEISSVLDEMEARVVATR